MRVIRDPRSGVVSRYAVDWPPSIADLPKRVVTVPGWGAFIVPRYIVRIDIEQEGKAGTHGWQLRLSKPFVLYSDRTKERQTANAAESLQEAVRHLGLLHEGPRLPPLSAEGWARSAKAKTGRSGSVRKTELDAEA